MINVNGLKRNAKNIVKKYSDAQVKVREATSNDPWGPSSTIMAEIADLTYNVVAFSEIMQMIWKRLNDHGKNWRHVYKALVVLEYLIKTGTEKVAQQCIENIFAIQTLKDFQYMEDNKDHGMNIREKSKKLVALLKDTEKLKAERARAIKAKTRLAESMSSVGKTSIGSMMSSSGSSGSGDTSANNNNNNTSNNYLNYQNDSGSSSSGPNHLPDVGGLAILGSDLDSARPQTATEEENQLKLALALSKEEAEQQEKTRKNDELRLKLALDVSKKTASTNLLDELSATPSSSINKQHANSSSTSSIPAPSTSTIDDLLGLSIPQPVEPIVTYNNDPWSVDPWQPMTSNHQSSIPPPTTTTIPAPTTVTNLSTLTQPTATIPATLSNQLPPQIPSLSSVPSSLLNSNNIFNSSANNSNNKRTISKNPFED